MSFRRKTYIFECQCIWCGNYWYLLSLFPQSQLPMKQCEGYEDLFEMHQLKQQSHFGSAFKLFDPAIMKRLIFKMVNVWGNNICCCSHVLTTLILLGFQSCLFVGYDQNSADMFIKGHNPKCCLFIRSIGGGVERRRGEKRLAEAIAEIKDGVPFSLGWVECKWNGIQKNRKCSIMFLIFFFLESLLVRDGHGLVLFWNKYLSHNNLNLNVDQVYEVRFWPCKGIMVINKGLGPSIESEV